MAISISPATLAKLAQKHKVSRAEVEQAFADRPDYVLLDTREEHASDPPTHWFIASTYDGRLLKICFIETDEDYVIRTAYPPDEIEKSIFFSAA